MPKTAEKSAELKAIEAEHNFVFGDDGTGETGNAPQIASVSCSTPGCSNLNRQYAVHQDSVLPLMCGGWVDVKGETGHPCGAVLHCDHSETTAHSHTEGTHAHPREVSYDLCDSCGSKLNEKKTDLPAIEFGDIPIGSLPLPVK